MTLNVDHVTYLTVQLYSEEKARLMVKQAQLADRGTPAMVLLVLTARDGEKNVCQGAVFVV